MGSDRPGMGKPVTPEQIAEWRRLVSGPSWTEGQQLNGGVLWDALFTDRYGFVDLVALVNTPEDLRRIVALREATGALLDEVERLDRQRKALRSAYQDRLDVLREGLGRIATRAHSEACRSRALLSPCFCPVGEAWAALAKLDALDELPKDEQPGAGGEP